MRHLEDLEIRRNLAVRFKAVREAKGMALRELTERAGIDAAAVCRWEKDRGVPNIVTCAKFARALDVSLDYLVGFTDTPEPLSQTERGRRVLKLRGKDVDIVDAVIDALIEKEERKRGHFSGKELLWGQTGR
jgi:transcriptional regulator with XRE-family HTH domain